MPGLSVPVHHTRPIYRMYIDEVGNADLGASNEPNHRFLSLTGVILKLEYVRDVLVPAFETIKRKYFVRDPDLKIIFHRKELLNHKYPFDALKDPAVCAAFDVEMLALFEQLEYVVITAVIDKLVHQNRYAAWAYHPYHYCLKVLAERFTMWLGEHGSRGDVMAEARGGKEDTALKLAFSEIHDGGTERMTAKVIQERLTSRELKVSPKHDNVAGLQLADLIAHASWKSMRLSREGQPQAHDFGGRIAALLLKSKYRRSWWGKVDGYGTKWLP